MHGYVPATSFFGEAARYSSSICKFALPVAGGIRAAMIWLLLLLVSSLHKGSGPLNRANSAPVPMRRLCLADYRKSDMPGLRSPYLL